MAAGLSPMMRHLVDIAGIQGVPQVVAGLGKLAFRRAQRFGGLAQRRLGAGEVRTQESWRRPGCPPCPSARLARVSVSAPTFCRLSDSDASSPFSWSL